MTWRPHYALLAALLFAVEAGIALFVHDGFVRPYLGDTLAVMLVYCGLRAMVAIRPLPAALLAFAIGAVIELGQAIHVLDLLGLHSRVLRILLGGSFAWLDFVAYAAGSAAMLALEKLRRRPSR